MKEETNKSWIDNLKKDGYEPTNAELVLKTNQLSRLLLNKTFKGSKVLELGCGNARNLIQLAAENRECHGIDISKEVILRAKNQKKICEDFLGRGLKIELTEQNIFEYQKENYFDLIFQVGVIEHFLEQSDRDEFHEMAKKNLKKGGYYINVVPHGFHPFRQQKKIMGLNGYNIPEIDYSFELAKKELERAGFEVDEIRSMCIFCYFQWAKMPSVFRMLKYLRVVELLPFNEIFKGHGTSLIFIGRKMSVKYATTAQLVEIGTGFLVSIIITRHFNQGDIGSIINIKNIMDIAAVFIFLPFVQLYIINAFKDKWKYGWMIVANGVIYLIFSVVALCVGEEGFLIEAVLLISAAKIISSLSQLNLMELSINLKYKEIFLIKSKSAVTSFAIFICGILMGPVIILIRELIYPLVSLITSTKGEMKLEAPCRKEIKEVVKRSAPLYLSQMADSLILPAFLFGASYHVGKQQIADFVYYMQYGILLNTLAAGYLVHILMPNIINVTKKVFVKKLSTFILIFFVLSVVYTLLFFEIRPYLFGEKWIFFYSKIDFWSFTFIWPIFNFVRISYVMMLSEKITYQAALVIVATLPGLSMMAFENHLMASLSLLIVIILLLMQINNNYQFKMIE